ncbi:uncharacterized protein LOC141582405 [Saimiri boliviensis]|uniref:uncharacterized protein LOC141582405 n=1 Tax=Saimiri boliviensis TaxID=27679 RepID=UPI003D76FC97
MDQFDGRANTLIPRFRRLTLTSPPHRRRRRLRQAQRVCTLLHGSALPTWSQLRRLTAEATQLVLEQGHSRSPAVMFIAMMAILSCQVSPSQAHSADSSQILWAYVPDPPILRPVTWTDPAFPVYLNDTSLFGFPSSTHITPQTANYSYFAQAASPPMCFYASKIWDQLALNIRIPFLPILPSTNGPFCFELGMKHLTTFEGPSALLKGSWRNDEDEVSKVSSSIYGTNSVICIAELGVMSAIPDKSLLGGFITAIKFHPGLEFKKAVATRLSAEAERCKVGSLRKLMNFGRAIVGTGKS